MVLLRQRRSLLGASLLLLFLYYGDVQLSALSLQGAQIEIRNEYAVTQLVWAIWLYFLIRYYQYYRTHGQGVRGSYNEFKKKLLDSRLEQLAPSVVEDAAINGPWVPLNTKVIRKGYRFELCSEGRGETQPAFGVAVSPLWVAWTIVRAYAMTASRTPRVMEHHLPFGLALTTGAYGMYKAFLRDWLTAVGAVIFSVFARTIDTLSNILNNLE